MSDNEGVLEKQATSSEILLYQTEDGKSKVEVRLENEMVWLSQKMLSELFQVSISTINEHIKNIFKEGELHEEAVIRNFRITASDNKTYLTKNHRSLLSTDDRCVEYRICGESRL